MLKSLCISVALGLCTADALVTAIVVAFTARTTPALAQIVTSDESQHDGWRDRDGYRDDRRDRRHRDQYRQRYIPPAPSLTSAVEPGLIWATFESAVYDAVPYFERTRHEAMFRLALASPLGQKQEWDTGALAGSITIINEQRLRGQICRDFIQTIRAPRWSRTADGRMCVDNAGPWRLVIY